MYLIGYSLDNLSLMALTVATGFVVDDAIVVLENVTRYIEDGHDAARGGAEGRQRGRLHRAVDEHLADRGVHPDPADGRHRRPPVPRVRRDALGCDPDLAGGFADDHADDVRACCCAAKPGRATAGSSAVQRALLRCDAGLLPAHADARAAPSRRCVDADPRRGARPQLLSVQRRPEGLLPAAGHRAGSSASSRPTRASRSS